MNHNEFNLAEMTSNSINGKTSAGKVAGMYTILIGSIGFALSFVYAFITKDAAITNSMLLSSTGLFASGAGMIMAKSIKPTTHTKDEQCSTGND